MRTLTQLEQVAIRTNLKQALCGTYFDITGVTNICQLMEIPYYVHNQHTPELKLAWNLLTALHCKHWVEFDEGTKHDLLGVVAQVLGLDLAEVMNAAPVLPAGQLRIVG